MSGFDGAGHLDPIVGNEIAASGYHPRGDVEGGPTAVTKADDPVAHTFSNSMSLVSPDPIDKLQRAARTAPGRPRSPATAQPGRDALDTLAMHD